MGDLFSPYTPSLPTGGTRPGGGGSSTAPWYTDPWLWANLAGTGADIWASTSSAARSNSTNVKLQREQRAWQEQMSNTEIQRRKADLIAAGGNPALAFTSGTGASSPSVAAPHVEPTYRGGQIGGAISAAAMMRAQLDQVKAQTQNISAQTGKTQVERDILEQIGGPSSAQDLEQKIKKNALFDQELRKAIADADISEANAQLLKEKRPLLMKLLDAQGDLANLDAQSAQQIAAALGVTGKDAGTVASMIKTIALILSRGR